jgi:hypothetical protein
MRREVEEHMARKTKTPDRPTARRRRRSPGATVSPEGASLASTVFHQEIAARAYELFVARGGQHGDDWADWFRAEAEVLGKMNRGGRPAGR